MSDHLNRIPSVTHFKRQEAGEPALSVAAQVRAWLAESRGPAERGQRAKELLRAIMPTAADYGFDAGSPDLSDEDNAPPALRIADTVMIVADQACIALSDICGRLRSHRLRPLVLLDDPLGVCHGCRIPISGAERGVEVLDLEQFVAAMAFKRAWLVPGRAAQGLEDIIGTCGLRTARFSI